MTRTQVILFGVEDYGLTVVSRSTMMSLVTFQQVLSVIRDRKKTSFDCGIETLMSRQSITRLHEETIKRLLVDLGHSHC